MGFWVAGGARSQGAQQPRSGYPEPAGSLGPVAAGGGEHRARGGPLDFRQRSGKGNGVGGSGGYAGRLELGDGEGPGRRQQDGALERVAELPDVAGPGMRQQGAAGLGCQRRPGGARGGGGTAQEEIRGAAPVPP